VGMRLKTYVISDVEQSFTRRAQATCDLSRRSVRDHLGCRVIPSVEGENAITVVVSWQISPDDV